MSKDRALKAVEALQRPPLTNIRERLRILADEIEDDVTAVLIVTYPKTNCYNFGKAMTFGEAAGTLFMVAHNLAQESRDTGEEFPDDSRA